MENEETEGWMPDMKEDLDIFIEFVKESEFRLEDIESGIMKLEEDPEDKEGLNDLLCQFHSIKGSAGLLNLTVMSKLSHDIESQLEDVREGVIKISQELVDHLFTSLDELKKLLQKVREEVDRLK